MYKNNKSKTVLKSLLFIMLCTFCVLFICACSENTDEIPDMTVRTFRATETGYDGYYIIKQNGMAVFQNLEHYSNEGELDMYMTFEYNLDGKISQRHMFDAQGNHIRTEKWVYYEDGKLKERNGYGAIDGEGELLFKNVYVEKGKEHLLEEGVTNYSVLEYDKFGRIVRWEEYREDELQSVTTTEYNKHGLVKETTVYEDERDNYVLELTPMD